MGARLAHRGAFGAQWSPAPGVWFGMQSRELSGLATDGPLLLDGALDNRWQLALRRGGAAPTESSPAGDATLLLELLEAEGPPALEALAGTFALAWWRSRERTLLLARDRIGYGPLHFTIDRAGRFVFASEYKALLALDTVDGAAEPRRHPGAPEHEVGEARRDLPRRHLSRRARRGSRDRRAARFRCSATGTFRSP